MLQIKIPVQQVQFGMYVAQLDRPWVETPFMFQGFLVREQSEIDLLRAHCSFVVIDCEKGISPGRGVAAGLPADIPPAPLPRASVHYESSVAVEEEMDVAREVRTAIAERVVELMSDLRAGRTPDLAGIGQTVSRMEASILRNPDAFMLLRQLRRKDSYSYDHCIDCSALAVTFGRQLGLPHSQLHDLAMGALLFDIGKSRIPEYLLIKNGALSANETKLVRLHVEFSLDILDKDGSMSPRVRGMVASHHERFDGSGYPRGLKGGEIPLLGRIAAIIDFYDAVTSERPFAAAMSPHSAIKYLYTFRNTHYQDELIEQFIQTIGAYPVGTLVELANGEVAVVIGQNQVRRLLPKVVVVLDADKQPVTEARTLDLMALANEPSDAALTIARSLEPGSYGVDPGDFYL
ncbi:MAG: HD-GYP domain-containing protein [Gammaproteobacteria bacterium]